MTEDYKKNLIDYATGDLQNTSPTTEEIFKEEIEVNRSKWIGYMPSSWTSMRIEGFIKPNENTSDLGVMYGGYTYNGSSHGFIILVDTNMNPVKYITKFSSGTDLRYIQCMIQGDDGYFYAIDDTELSWRNTNISNTQKRFLMLNNFSVAIEGNYKVVLRTSYILNGSYQNFYCKDIFKEPSLSHFVFCGWYASSSTSAANRIKAIELKVNVGTANEWFNYQVDNNITSQANLVTFNSSNQAKIQIVAVPVASYDCYLYTKNFSSNTLSQSTFYTCPYRTYINYDLEQQGLFLDSNNFYFIMDTQDLTGSGLSFERHLALIHYNISNNKLETIYDNYMGSTTTSVNNERMQIDSNEGKLYIALYNNFVGNSTADYSIQRYEGSWNPIKVGTAKNFLRTQRALYVGNKYNLLQIVLYPTNLRNASWYFFIAKEIYNQNQYNGESYVGVDSFCPLLSNLYSNGSLMFSRNLYNISKQNNMSMSSVEIPNSYLNDTTITQNDLIGETNVELVNDPTQWTKNIYEVVDVNFLNTIRVIDEDTGTEYLESAIKLNNSTTDGGSTNYQNTPCNKFRINYNDSTSSIHSLEWKSINRFNKTTSITIYVDKAINSIDYLSYDENTIYLHVPLEVEVDKYYTIHQKVRTGNKPTAVQLQYNNEDINYQNQPVMVYVEE
jgi:hypothetical protein